MKKKILIIIIAVVLAVVASGTVVAIILTNSKSDEGENGMSKEIMEGLAEDGLYAAIDTDKGRILLNLHYEQTPLTVCNFVSLAEGTMDAAKGKPYYDGLNFHRVIADFMIQGGCPLGTGTGDPGYKFPDEIVDELRHECPGVLSMANSGPNTNGSQFFITHVATPWLDGKHTVFGKVVSGQDVVDAIAQGDKIKKITIVRKGENAKAFKTGQEAFNSYLLAAKEKAEKANAEFEAKMEALIKEKYASAKKDDDGVYFFVTEEGKGDAVKKGQTLTMKYKGSLLSNGMVFDDSDMHKPLEFKAAAGMLIPGFDSQAAKMRVGEKRTIIIPPHLAYGAQGAGGVIPPNAYLVFELELLDAK